MSLENETKSITEKLRKCDIRTKGLGLLPPTDISDEGKYTGSSEIKWNLLKEDVSFPAAVINEKLLRSNVSWMKSFMEFYEFRHCPHGKTTMCPDLFKMQLEEGNVWGITFATAPQVQLGHTFGVPRVLLANQLVGKVNMEIISTILEKDPSFSFHCIVDSAENVNHLGEFFKSKNQQIKILLEVGINGGRCGIRTENDDSSIIAAISKWKGTLNFVGVEFFEGVFKEESIIRDFIRKAIAKTEELFKENVFDDKQVIITGAGTAWYDVVAEELSQAKLQLQSSGLSLEIILRPGCYITHDKGSYTNIDQRIENRIPVKSLEGKRLLPALQIWAYVQSIPESFLAIIGFGRRDVSFDCGFPIPSLHFRSGWKSPRKASPHWRVANMMDQHVFLNFSVEKQEQGNTGKLHSDSSEEEEKEEESLQVGDIVIFDIIHACTTFDKWKHILLTDDNFNVIDIFTTYF